MSTHYYKVTQLQVDRLIESLTKSVGKVNITKVDPEGKIWKIVFPFKDYLGASFKVYLFKWPGDPRFVLSDGGALIKAIKGCGIARLNAIQGVLATFQLLLMEDLSVMSTDDRPINKRIMSFIQACCTIDGIIRVWDISQKEVQKSTDINRTVESEETDG